MLNFPHAEVSAPESFACESLKRSPCSLLRVANVTGFIFAARALPDAMKLGSLSLEIIFVSAGLKEKHNFSHADVSQERRAQWKEN